MKYQLRPSNKFRWVGECVRSSRGRKKENITFYQEFQFGTLYAQVGDFVLVSSADAAEPDTIEGCDVAKLVELYETDRDEEDPYRAVVQWYTRPDQLPRTVENHGLPYPEFSTKYEVVEEHRKFDNDISLETIFKRCVVITAEPHESPASVAKKHENGLPVFVVRFKLSVKRRKYEIETLQKEEFVKKKGARQSLFMDKLLNNSCDKNKNGLNCDRSRSVSPEIPYTGPSVKYELAPENESSPARSKVGRKPKTQDNEVNNGSNKSSKVISNNRYTAVETVVSSGGKKQKLKFLCYRTDDRDSSETSDVEVKKRSKYIPKVRDEDISVLLDDENEEEQSDSSVEISPKRRKRLQNNDKPIRTDVGESYREDKSSLSSRRSDRRCRERTALKKSTSTSVLVNRHSALNLDSPREKRKDSSSSQAYSCSDNKFQRSPSAKLKRQAQSLTNIQSKRLAEVDDDDHRQKERHIVVQDNLELLRKCLQPSEKYSQCRSVRKSARDRCKTIGSCDNDSPRRRLSRSVPKVNYWEVESDVGNREDDSRLPESGCDNFDMGDEDFKPNYFKLRKLCPKSEPRTKLEKLLCLKFNRSPSGKYKVSVSPQCVSGTGHPEEQQKQNTTPRGRRKQDKSESSESGDLRSSARQKKKHVVALFSDEDDSSDRHSSRQQRLNSSLEPPVSSNTQSPCRTPRSSKKAASASTKSTKMKQVEQKAASGESDFDPSSSMSTDEGSDDEFYPKPRGKKKGAQTPKTPKTTGTPRTPRVSRTPRTPKSSQFSGRKKVITPSLPSRQSSVATPRGPLEEARARLHVSAVPDSLPCRENEFANIYSFVEGKILDGAGGCMYVSGVPGTGKTATVQEVVKNLQNSYEQGDLPEFTFVEINGMRLTEPRQAYVQILMALTGKKATADQAQQLLETRFSRPAPRRISTLLLVDELDLLWTKRQDVVYNLLDWPSKVNSRLIVITIANTMDLPERLLMGRVTSRLGLTRLTFQPYTYKQLQEIVTARIVGLQAFDPDAIQLVARKVAAVSGDARRALDICRRATEIAELDMRSGRTPSKSPKKPKQLVSMVHVDQALNEMISSFKVRAIRSCSRMEQLFLQAVMGEVQRTGVEETVFDRVYQQMVGLCVFDGYRTPNTSEALKICARLGSCRLLITEDFSTSIHQRILLNVSADDLHYALQKIADVGNGD